MSSQFACERNYTPAVAVAPAPAPAVPFTQYFKQSMCALVSLLFLVAAPFFFSANIPYKHTYTIKHALFKCYRNEFIRSLKSPATLAVKNSSAYTFLDEQATGYIDYRLTAIHDRFKCTYLDEHSNQPNKSSRRAKRNRKKRLREKKKTLERRKKNVLNLNLVSI